MTMRYLLPLVALLAGGVARAQPPLPPDPAIVAERPLMDMLRAVRAAATSRAGCDPRFAPKDAAKLLLHVRAPIPLVDGNLLSFGVRSPDSDAIEYSVMIDCRGRRRCGSFALFVGIVPAASPPSAADAIRIFGRSYYHDIDPNIPTMHQPLPAPGSLGFVRFRLPHAARAMGKRCPRTVWASFDDQNRLASVRIVSGE